VNKIVFFLVFFVSLQVVSAKTYPFLYIPGMFDNGDLFNDEYAVAKTLNSVDGFYYTTYFSTGNVYDKEPLIIGSSIVNTKFQRLSVANLLGPRRQNISLYTMTDRLFAHIQGKSPRGKLLQCITRYKGNDFSGSVMRNGVSIQYRGLIEELWVKYGKDVSYQKKNDVFNVVLYPVAEKKYLSYSNADFYFSTPDEIKFNVVAHSSGGLSIRKYIEMCLNEGINHHVNQIINLSVPQEGARMNFRLKTAFPVLINDAIANIFAHKDTKSIALRDKVYTYKELINKSNLSMLQGDSFSAKNMQKLVGDYILYFIPFDGYHGVLGFDPALKDLRPDSRFVQSIKNKKLPDGISVYNYRVEKPYSPMFYNISRYLELGLSDGVVDFDDTFTGNIIDSDRTTTIVVDKANHIPFPYIKPLYELDKTIEQYYPFLSILIKQPQKRKEGIDIVQALFLSIMEEFNFNLEYFLANEDYSVIDYFADNPVTISGI